MANPVSWNLGHLLLTVGDVIVATPGEAFTLRTVSVVCDTDRVLDVLPECVLQAVVVRVRRTAEQVAELHVVRPVLKYAVDEYGAAYGL